MKLYYFDIVGRAECIKLLLTHANVPFEDVRIKMQDWPKLKNKFELKQVPVLEHEGKFYCQSIAILEYLGVKYGYFPKKNFKKIYKIMYVIRTMEDAYSRAFMVTSSRSPLDEKTKAEKLKKFISEEGPVFMRALEKVLKENVTQDFLVGHKYTIADFCVLASYIGMQANEDFKKHFEGCIAKNYPVLWEYVQKRTKDFNSYYKKCKKKLYYFEFPGRVEMIRLLLRYLGIPFEDVKIDFKKDWAKEKACGKFELQQLPVLECETCGTTECQTDTIMHKICAAHNLLPLSNPDKMYKVTWWCNIAKDLMDGSTVLYQDIPEENKKKLKEHYFKNVIPTLFTTMEERLKSNYSQQYLVGNKNTMADFYLVGVWKGFVTDSDFEEFKEIIPKYSTLGKYIEWKTKLF